MPCPAPPATCAFRGGSARAGHWPWAERLLPERLRWLITGAFFGALLLGGWLLTPGYGSYTDELMGRDSGQISLVYAYEWVPPQWLPTAARARLAATTPAQRLPQYADREYGVAFELPMTLVEKASGYTDLGDVLRLRHRCVWLLGVAGIAAFGWLAGRRLGSWRLGLLGALLLVLSPRQLADFFYNTKDAVFLAAMVLATATAVAFVERPGAGRAGAHALACAFAIGVRVMGVLVPVLTLALVLLRVLHGDYAGRGRPVAGAVAVYVLLLPTLVVAGWPYLWPAPAAHFAEAFASMSHYAWFPSLLFAGRLYPPHAALPWYYAPQWLLLTVPLPYLAGLGLAAGLLLRQLWRRGWRLYATVGEWQDLLLWALGLGPLVAVAGLGSVLYDGWRQLYFAYPPLLLLALRGWVAAWRGLPVAVAWGRWLRVGLALAGAGALAQVAGAMAVLHPFENLYFNALAGAHPERRYDYDYWGLTLGRGLAWLARHDHRPLVRVSGNEQFSCMTANLALLDADARARLRPVREQEPADYFMTTFRAHPEPYPLGEPVYTLRIGGAGQRALAIYRLPPPGRLPPAVLRHL